MNSYVSQVLNIMKSVNFSNHRLCVIMVYEALLASTKACISYSNFTFFLIVFCSLIRLILVRKIRVNHSISLPQSYAVNYRLVDWLGFTGSRSKIGNETPKRETIKVIYRFHCILSIFVLRENEFKILEDFTKITDWINRFRTRILLRWSRDDFTLLAGE